MHLTDFQKIVAMNTIAGVGMGLVGIFIPIYLLELNFSLSVVIAWLLIHHVSLLLGTFIAIYLANGIGLIRCLFIRVVLVTVLFSGLFLLPTYPAFIFSLALLSGLEAAFFWMPYNILTVRHTHDATIGSALAFMANVGALVGIAVPGIAAFIIVSFGYGALFALAFLFILSSIVPVLSLRHEKTNFQFSWSAVKNIVRSNRHFIVPEILDNLGQDAQVIWSLFIFITALTVLDIGTLGVLSGLAGIGVTYFTGRLIDTWDKKSLVRISAITTTLMWVVSYFVAVYIPTPGPLYVVTVLRGFVLGIFASSYGAIMFNRARGADAQFLVLREIPTVFGRVVLFVVTLVLLYVGQFELVFIVVALLSLYFWFNNLDVLTRNPQLEKI